jgi:ATP-dependent helicase HepA
MASRFAPGQRWLSQTEPELGLGLVIKSEPDKVTIMFPSSETTRVYTIEAPPLTRVRFSIGDILKTQDGKSFLVEEVTEKDGIVIYLSKGKKIDESRLSDSLTFSKPIDRLLNAQVDDKGIYNLRHRALYRRFKTYRSPLRGLHGGKFHPAAHQLYVAQQATRVCYPRVLLADEPGLGRRIEAGLILQRMAVAGTAQRVLLLSPEAQLDWCALEFQRRFDFQFTALTSDDLTPPAKPVAKKAAKAKADEPLAAPFNPFVREDAAWISCPLELFKSKPAHWAAAAEFDVIIVDGGETISWQEAAPTPAYNALEEALSAAKSVILLSAAGPEADLEAHIGRIRLLDPEEFPTTRKYNKHRKETEALSAAVIAAVHAADIDRETESLLKPLTADDAKAKELLKAWKEDKENARDQLIEHLLDRQECGRSVFRNTRHSLAKLPSKEVDWVKLEAKPEVRDELREEFKSAGKVEVSGKPKAIPSAVDSALTTWLYGIISPPILPAVVVALPKGTEATPAPAPSPKALVVCTNRGRAMAAAKALTKKLPDKVVLVTNEPHEVPNPEFAAIVVGLEDTCGRSFSGVDFIVFWDLPYHATEARLGAGLLDFASESSVKVMLPYVEDTPQELLARWLHEGVDAFTGYSPAQTTVIDEFAKSAIDLARRIGVRHNPKIEEELRALIKKSHAAYESAAKKIDKHRDQLLETASCRPTFAERDLTRLNTSDEDKSLDLFTTRVLEQCGISVEAPTPRCASLLWNPESIYHLDAVPKEGINLTFSRKIALSQEPLLHLTWDSDLVFAATERLIATAVGNTAYVVWEDDRAQLVLLEGIFLAEPVMEDPACQVWRFMPPTPIRVVVSHEMEDLSTTYNTELVNANVRNGRKDWLRNNARPLHNLIPGMLRNLHQRAEMKSQDLAAKAAHQMEVILTSEKQRLENLPQTTIRAAEVARIGQQIATLKKQLLNPTLSLDSIRLIRRGPSGKGI